MSFCFKAPHAEGVVRYHDGVLIIVFHSANKTKSDAQRSIHELRGWKNGSFQIFRISNNAIPTMPCPDEHCWTLPYNYGKEKKRTLCFASFCSTMGLNHRKSMTVLKLCKKSFKCDVAGHCSFIRLEMAMVWRKKSLIEKSAYFNVFPMSDFSLSVFVNNAAQDCLSYSLSMSKLKSFKFSLNLCHL